MGASAFELVSETLALGAGVILPAFVVLELASYRLSRAAPSPWVSAIYQSAWIGWTFSSIFPYGS